MKRVLLSLLLSSAFASAQTVEWFLPQQELSNGQNVAYSTVCDPQGNIYFSGFKQNAFSYNDTYGDVYYTKYDGTGAVLFDKSFTGKVASYNLAADNESNIIIALSFIDAITIGEITLEENAVEPARMIAKLDQEGNLLWYKVLEIETVSGTNFVSDFRGLAIDADNNIYAAFDNYSDSYIVKYSPNGDVLMDIEQQNVNRITSVAVDTDGNIYSAGACAGLNAEYAGIEAPTEFAYNTYVAKYSASGIFQWVKYVDDITCPEPRVIARTPDEVYMSSFLFIDTSFDEIDIEGPAQAFEDFFIAKLDANGDYQWVREVPGIGSAAQGSRNFLNFDNSGNIYFAGYASGTIDWNAAIQTSVNGFGNRDALIVKYSPEGEVLMAKNFGAESYERIDGIAINAEGDIFAAGMVSGTGDFGGFEYQGEPWEHKPYIVKISEFTAGLPTNNFQSIMVYPNPATDYFIASANERITGKIFNSLGQQVIDFSTDGATPVNVSQLPSGTYYIKADGFASAKLIKR